MFGLRDSSPFHHLSDPQQEALDAIRETDSSGIVVLPCGSGKTCVFLRAALEAGRKVLFLCFEKQGVAQVAAVIKQHSTIDPRFVCVCTGEKKPEPNSLFCFLVGTYSLFTSSATGTSTLDTTTRLRQFVQSTHWDLVVLDECHHAAAPTYKPLVESLRATRKLGFTGTLCRSDVACSQRGDERTDAVERHFKFIGPVLYRRSCAELENDGLIARVRCMEVVTTLVPEFKKAYDHLNVGGQTRKYVASLHPQKLNAVSTIVTLHRSMGELGMIFVFHHLHAKVLKDMLGSKWEILAGGHAHGEDGTHSTSANAAVVDRFNRGELDGLISTAVGESALDVWNQDFRYAIVVDAHSGAASASQKLGRLARTPRLPREEEESNSEYRQRRLENQKHACFYDLVTNETEETTASAQRRRQLSEEGYDCSIVEYNVLRSELGRFQNETEPVVLPCETELQRIRLLIETLDYTTKGHAAAIGATEARKHRDEHRKDMKRAETRSTEASNSLFRERHRRAHASLKKRSKEVKTIAQAISKRAVTEAPLGLVALNVLRDVEVSAAVLNELGIVLPQQPRLPTSSDEDSP
jgi:superfamily II DNA or RNA helicase